MPPLCASDSQACLGCRRALETVKGDNRFSCKFESAYMLGVIKGVNHGRPNDCKSVRKCIDPIGPAAYGVKIITVSLLDADHVRELYPILAGKIIDIPAIVHVGAFDAQRQEIGYLAADGQKPR